jgi:hypothetical protein
MIRHVADEQWGFAVRHGDVARHDMPRLAGAAAMLLGSLGLLGLAGCATAPRAPAARLADAGMAATASFSSETAATGQLVASGGVTDAFVRRMLVCRPPATACATALPIDRNAQQRAELASIIALRAAALTALNRAYAAMKQEAEYDARADLSGAVAEAVNSGNAFAAAVRTIAAPLIPIDAGKLAAVAAGAIADQGQKRRLQAANAALRAVTQQLHDALAVEASVFETIGKSIEQRRTEAFQTMFNAGLIDGDDQLRAMATALGVTLKNGAAATVAASPALKAAVTDMIAAQGQLDSLRAGARYRASLNALQALVVEHDHLAQRTNVSLEEVARLLAEVNAAIGTPPAAALPAQTAQTPK